MASQSQSFLLIYLLTNTFMVDASRYIFVGAGGCDSDDPTCYEPDGTNLITTCSLSSNGQLDIIETISGIKDPAWLIQHPDMDVLYATETGGSGIWSLAISNTTDVAPKLTLGNYVETGDAPVYLSFDITNQYLFVANYNGGSLSAVKLDDIGQVSFLSSQVLKKKIQIYCTTYINFCLFQVKKNGYMNIFASL